MKYRGINAEALMNMMGQRKKDMGKECVLILMTEDVFTEFRKNSGFPQDKNFGVLGMLRKGRLTFLGVEIAILGGKDRLVLG